MTETHAPRARARVLDDLRRPAPPPAHDLAMNLQRLGGHTLPTAAGARRSRHTPPTARPRTRAPQPELRAALPPARAEAGRAADDRPALRLEIAAALVGFALAFAFTLTRQDLDAALVVLTFALLTTVALIVLRAELDDGAYDPGRRALEHPRS
ncbi:MAG: hypothetical protein R3A79_14340 [Nannocystaceae bacterium]